MADHTERYVKLYDIGIAPAKAHLSPLTQRSVQDFRPLLQAVLDAAAAKNMLRDDPDPSGRQLYLMDMEVHEHSKHIIFVWTLTDPNTAAQMYLNKSKYDLRPATKGDDEEVAISSHMVVDFDVPQNHFRYPTALEDHEGISRTRVQGLLQRLLQEFIPSVTAVLEDGLEKSGAPKLLMDARPGRIMGKSELSPIEIEVIKLGKRNVITADSVEYYYQSSEKLTFKLGRPGELAEIRSNAMRLIHRIRREKPDHAIRIRWRDPQDPTTTEVTKVDPMEQPDRLLERALTRTVHLTGFRGLPDATDKVVRRLADRMVQALRHAVLEDAKS